MNDYTHATVLARLEAGNPVDHARLEDFDAQRPELADLLRRGEQLLPQEAEGVPFARRTRRRFVGHLRITFATAVGVAGLAAAAAAAVFFTASSPSEAAIVRNALAAVGQGRVLHVVARTEPNVQTIDLASGRRIRAFQVVEEWYQPGVGLRARLIASNAFRPKALPSIADVPSAYIAALNGFASRYERALADGQATVRKHGRLLGEKVVWLHFTGTRDAAYEVAVDSQTYKPLFLRQLKGGGVPFAGSGMRLLSVETVASVPRSAPPAPTPDVRTLAGVDVVGELSAAEAANFMTRHGLWLGSEYAGLPLAKIEGLRYSYGHGEQFSDVKNHWNGLRLIYGRVDQYGKPVDGERWVMLDEQTNPVDGPGNPPVDGTLLMTDDFAGEAQVDGVYVSISARAASGPDRDLLIAAARDLKPIPSSG